MTLDDIQTLTCFCNAGHEMRCMGAWPGAGPEYNMYIGFHCVSCNQYVKLYPPAPVKAEMITEGAA